MKVPRRARADRLVARYSHVSGFKISKATNCLSIKPLSCGFVGERVTAIGPALSAREVRVADQSQPAEAVTCAE
jgi:hypothetical protein